MPKRMRQFEFTIVVKNLGDAHEEYADKLYAICSDAMLGRQDGCDFIDFLRKSPDFQEAVTTAIQDVRKARMTPIRIKLDEYANASDIAERIQRSRQSVNQLIRGTRGPGGFPAPAYVSRGNIASYAWMDVIDWLREHDFDTRLSRTQMERFVAASSMNAVLQLQRNLGSISKAQQLWKKTKV